MVTSYQYFNKVKMQPDFYTAKPRLRVSKRSAQAFRLAKQVFAFDLKKGNTRLQAFQGIAP